MDFYEAFAHTWGSTGTVDDSLTATQYDQGWNFIGARPPRLGEFNKREKLIDQRLKWLYDQLKTAADAHGVTLNGSDVGGLLAILQDLIGDHTSAADPHPQYAKTAELPCVGVGQVWTDVTSLRSAGVTYYNTTTKPIVVNIASAHTNRSVFTLLTIGGVAVYGFGDLDTTGSSGYSWIVPPGASYVASASSGSLFINSWLELR